jgi:hypothetical protein
MLSLKYALFRNVIKTMPHSIYNMRFIEDAGRKYFLESVFLRINTPIIIPAAISVKELENVTPKRMAHKAISMTRFNTLISIF